MLQFHMLVQVLPVIVLFATNHTHEWLLLSSYAVAFVSFVHFLDLCWLSFDKLTLILNIVAIFCFGANATFVHDLIFRLGAIATFVHDLIFKFQSSIFQSFGVGWLCGAHG